MKKGMLTWVVAWLLLCMVTPVVNAENAAVVIGTETVMEYEDFVDCFDTAGTVCTPETNPGNTASGGSYIIYDTPHRETDLYADISVFVEKSGYYYVESMTSTYCAMTLYVDDVQKSMTKGTAETRASSGSVAFLYYASNVYRAVPYTAYVYLSAGTHTISPCVIRRTESATSTDVAAALDYISFTLDTTLPEATVLAEGVSTVEMEHYAPYVVLDGRTLLEAASVEHAKGTYLDVREIRATDGVRVNIPIKVEQAGWYYMDAVMGLQVNNWVSAVSVFVEEEKVLQNNGDFSVENLSLAEDGTAIDYVSSNYPMYRFRNRCFLQEGEQTVTVYAKKRVNVDSNDSTQVKDAENGIYRTCFVMDCISFSPVADSAGKQDGKVTVSTYFDKAVSGNVIVAAYSGKELVGVHMSTATEITEFHGEVTYEKEPTSVKIFVWKNMDTLVPITKTKEMIFH